MAAYQWKIPGVYRVEAQTAQNEFERIYQKNGKLEPEDVVEENTLEGTPLHDEFEWDDVKAANAYRVGQASDMIRALVVVQEPEESQPVEVRAFVHTQGTYHPIGVAINTPDMLDEIIKDAFRDMLSFKKKYKAYQQFKGVISAIDTVLDNKDEILGGMNDE